MTDFNQNTYAFDPNDPYSLDAQRIIEENAKKSGPKVLWLNLPDGEATSTWRILMWPKRRTFFRKIAKHWNVPGYKGAVTCPRSFQDEGTAENFPCALCDESYRLSKSKDPIDAALAKQLRATTNYYVNAYDVNDPEQKVGVLNIPYAVFKQLFDWLSVPGYQLFAHPFRGRNITIKSTIVPGAKVPGSSGKNKREYTVTASLQEAPVDEALMEKLWDLDFIMGVPTLEFTQACLEKVRTGDPEAGKQLVSGTGYRQLTAGNAEGGGEDFFPGAQQEETPAAPPTTVPPVQTTGFIAPAQTVASVTSPAQTAVNVGSPKPAFASTPTASAVVGKIVPLADAPATGNKACFGIAFDENNKTCLKCPTNEGCELAVLKAARAAKQNAPAPSTDSTDTLGAEMMAALGGK